MNIYVSNLPYQTTDDELMRTFQSFGEVNSARVIKDKISGRSRGFGFVEMANESEAQAALDSVNEMELDGRKLNAREARPRSEEAGFRNDSSPKREGRPSRDAIRSNY